LIEFVAPAIAALKQAIVSRIEAGQKDRWLTIGTLRRGGPMVGESTESLVNDPAVCDFVSDAS
jgi:hypothetical protein